ncbi:MAG: M42 family metallopeptidase [Bacillota bacterium]|nr:M42 family metallopeptidase [Bacillota bacterium]
METKEFLRRLSEGVGVSGYEHGLHDLIREALAPYAGEFSTDALGNCVAVRRGCGEEPRVSVMLAAHQDEIGLMVTKIDERGFLRVAQVGGFDPRVLVAQEVVVHGRRSLPGIIGMKPPHILTDEERKKAPKLEDLFIDIGLPAGEARETVQVGDVVTLNRAFTELHGGLVAGKSLDDRAGVAALLECLRRLQSLRHAADIYAVATTQEEVGLRGATTSAYGLHPDLAVAIDVCHAGPGLDEPGASELGKGPAVAVGANIHPKLRDLLLAVAADCGIPIQHEVSPGATGTDAWAINIARAGIPTALLSIPLRYMHTSVETAAMSDVVQTGRLLAEFCGRVDRALVEGLRWN